MHVCGIIAEYNPFHSGHAYQIAQARADSGCDYLIVIMSGDFVQRGAPAITDKYIRARMALEAGADLVLMMPVYASTASAEGFARAGVATLHTTGVADAISFGCENPAICGKPYRDLAHMLSAEPAEFQAMLQSGLSSGFSYAQARSRAIHHCCADTCDPVLLDHPNNLLAFEYMRAIEYTHANLRLYPVRRLGSYHDSTGATADPDRAGITGSPGSIGTAASPDSSGDIQEFLSASACRSMLIDEPETALHTLYAQAQMPARSIALLRQYEDAYAFLSENDLTAQLHYALLTQQRCGYAAYLDCATDLSARILRSLGAYDHFSAFCDLLKNKSLTRARIARVLTHILLQLPAQPATPLIDDSGYIPYLRVLGFRSSAADLLHGIKQQSHAPLITRPAQIHELAHTDSDQDAMQEYFSQDLLASDVYRSALLHKCGRCYADDYRRRIEIV